jgi:maltokinase
MTLEHSLATWLPAQRWYPGGIADDLAVVADTLLAVGDPELRHLIITASRGGAAARYQVLAGVRAVVPDELSHAVIGPDGSGRTAYDALHDPELTRVLLRGICAERADAGTLRFAREPAAPIEDTADSYVLSAEQSNTSLVFGESTILKVFRRVFAGQNPDLEVTRALARLGSAHVARPFGWIEARLDDGEPALLAILSEYLRGACDGWTLAATSVRDLYADTSRAAEAGGDFAGEASRLGAATASVHADLATAFGTSLLEPAAVAELAAQMLSRFEAASAEVPELAAHAGKIAAAYARLADLGAALPTQRVHGDYHLAQVLRTQAGWVVLDFEGEPATSLARRRSRSPALQDVAGMLRSFDYAARHQLMGRPGEARLSEAAREWVARNQSAFCAGYAEANGTDPRAQATALRALMLDKAVYEVTYEARYRPSWASIPLDAIAGM